MEINKQNDVRIAGIVESIRKLAKEELKVEQLLQSNRQVFIFSKGSDVQFKIILFDSAPKKVLEANAEFFNEAYEKIVKKAFARSRMHSILKIYPFPLPSEATLMRVEGKKHEVNPKPKCIEYFAMR